MSVQTHGRSHSELVEDIAHDPTVRLAFMDRSQDGPGWLSLTAPALEAADDATIAALPTAPVRYMKDRALGELAQNGLGYPALRDPRWDLAFMRAWAVLSRKDAWLRSKRSSALGSPSQLVASAALVADYHAMKWADPEIKADGLGKDEPWPTTRQLCERWKVDLHQLLHVLYEAAHRKWEHRYTLSESRETRMERLRIRVHQDVQDQALVSPDKRNAKLYEVAAKLEGEPMGAAPTVNIGARTSTTTNVVIGADVSAAELERRMTRALSAINGKHRALPRAVDAVEVSDEAQA